MLQATTIPIGPCFSVVLTACFYLKGIFSLGEYPQREAEQLSHSPAEPQQQPHLETVL